MTTIEIVRSTRVIPADAAAVFDLLVNPAEHSRIDGSGSVRGAQSGTPQRLSLGAKFGMQMRMGAPYKIVNEVVELEEGRGSPGGTSAATSGATCWFRLERTRPR